MQARLQALMPTGSARVAPAPEVHEVPLVRVVSSRRCRTPLPAGYVVMERADGRYVIAHAGQVLTKIEHDQLVERSYKRIDGARRWIRQHAQ